ncbi:hypothetical protein CYMTET_4626 [Cymbomonas tetramitiformis]|uniref:Uncharacterized protein n=1 Tax=Cymbomonas tetramitiformis TaxID=36881 RepID=A0AAE0H119_9CHLO|nr:hypothetical protein CYMTET_4626 [Cymbomonas tetramitiformis]
MARIAEMEQRLSSHPQSSNPPAAVVMQTAGGVAGPTQDDINDMRSHGRDIIEKRMEKGDIPVGATSSRLKSSLVRDVIEEIHAVTPSVPKRQVSMYLTSRLAYLKNTKATEGRWKQKFTKQFPDGYFARYEGPARGFRLFGRAESLITAAETEAILDFQEAGRPKSGPLYDAVKSINGWTKESIPDDGQGEEEEKKVKVEEPPPQKQKEPLTESEEDGKLTSGRFVEIFHGAQKGHKSRPPADTDSFTNISKFCIARGLLDVVGEGPTGVASLKGLVVPKDCVEVTLYAIKDEEDYIFRMLSHHAEGIKLLKKKMGKEAKIKGEDLAHDESSIVPAVKNKPTVWIPTKYVRNSTVQTDKNVDFGKKRKAAAPEGSSKQQKKEEEEKKGEEVVDEKEGDEKDDDEDEDDEKGDEDDEEDAAA